jgi:hypothetical protein
VSEPTHPLASRLQDLLHQYCEELAKTVREIRPQLMALAEELREGATALEQRAARESSPDLGGGR